MSDDSGHTSEQNSKDPSTSSSSNSDDKKQLPSSSSSSSPSSSSKTKSTTSQQSQIDGPYSTSQINPNMTTKEAYFELLRTWIHQANMSQSAMACFPYYLKTNYPQLFQQQQQQQHENLLSGVSASTIAGLSRRNVFGQSAGGFGGGFAGIGAGLNGVGGGINVGNMQGLRGNDRRIGDYFDNDTRQIQEELINLNGGYEFVIAPFWKRFLAEMIDSVILLLLKLILTFIISDMFDLNFGIAFNFDNLKKSIEDDYAEFLSFSSDLLLIEILTKIFVCFYEALWTSAGHIYVGGATPGKIFMGIRIVYAEAVVPLPPLNQQQQQGQQGFNFLNINNNNNNNNNNNINILNNNGSGQLKALLFPASNPGFKRALLRAMAKNILMALLFPMCFIILFFKNNRTAYDVMTKTIVVEENPAPILRRRVQ